MISRLPALGVALVCAVLAIYLAVNAKDASDVRRADRLGGAGRFAEAAQVAASVDRAPADARALITRARALTLLRRRTEANAAWRTAAERLPNDWKVHYLWTRALFYLGARPAQYLEHYLRARELNPRLPPLTGARGSG